ncbi:trichothecene 3-O-acetyltransferase [Apiospora marii]|uniref:trichothecene 3-O-acetyltransferase n=1 Tax=Apiospora marii TaxID=335849 RepID=UPI00312D836F
MASDSLDVCLDIFGQHPRHSQIYTPVCFGFPCDEQHISEKSVLAHFQAGLERLTRGFPWITGQVVRGDDGIFRIRPYREAPSITVKDLRREFPPIIADLLKPGGGGGIPASLLDESTLAPCGTFRQPTGRGTTGPATPVFLLQANIVPGGLLLVVNGLHSCMDMAGQAQMIRLLAKACRGEPFTTEELSTGNMPRSDILLPLLDIFDEEILKGSKEPIASLAEDKDDQANSPAAAAAAADRPGEQRRPPQTPICWSTFIFSRPALQALKTAASATMPSAQEEEGEHIPFISTDDALSALLWQSITRSRLPRLSPPSPPPSPAEPTTTTTTTTLTRTVDARKYVPGLSPAYPGDAACKVSSTFDAASLANKPLGAIAAALRARLRPDEVCDGIRAHATKLARARDGARVRVNGDNSSSGSNSLDPSTGCESELVGQGVVL